MQIRLNINVVYFALKSASNAVILSNMSTKAEAITTTQKRRTFSSRFPFEHISYARDARISSASRVYTMHICLFNGYMHFTCVDPWIHFHWKRMHIKDASVSAFSFKNHLNADITKLQPHRNPTYTNINCISIKFNSIIPLNTFPFVLQDINVTIVHHCA